MKLFSHIKSPLLCLVFTPDGSSLLAAAQGCRTVGIWELPAGRFRRWNPVADTWVRSLAFSAEGKYLAVGNNWGMSFPYFWAKKDYNSECHAGSPFGDKIPIYDQAFAPDQPLLATASQGIALWALDQGDDLWGHPLSRDWRIYAAVAFAPDGKAVAGGWKGHRLVSLWHLGSDLKPRQEETQLAVPQKPASVAFAPDGLTLAIASGNSVFLYDLRSDKTRASLQHARGRINQLTYQERSHLLATAGDDGTVRFWDTQENRELRSFSWNIGKVRRVVFAPDGMTCAAGGDKGQVVLWDVDV